MAIEHPDKALWTYYLLRCVVIPPLFPILVLPSYFRYHTMRYKFTEEGISMSWGILFRHEVILNYARIQDIHLRSNIVERWLGLARILVQTASGSSCGRDDHRRPKAVSGGPGFSLFQDARGQRRGPSPAIAANARRSRRQRRRARRGPGGNVAGGGE